MYRVRRKSDHDPDSFGDIISFSTDRMADETVQKVHTWLHTVGIECDDQHTFFEGYVGALRDAGLPVDRFFCAANVVHPLIKTLAWKWLDGNMTDIEWTKIDAAAYEESQREL